MKGVVFQDDEGNISSMNFVWMVSIATIVIMWIFTSIRLNELQHLTGGDVLWFTSLFSGKLAQNYCEKKLPSKGNEAGKRSGLIQNDRGQTNPTRLIWIAAVLGIIGTWAYISYTTTQMQHFSTGDAAWFTSLFGSKVGGTVVERMKEKDKD